jgi:hypothetical protein
MRDRMTYVGYLEEEATGSNGYHGLRQVVTSLPRQFLDQISVSASTHKVMIALFIEGVHEAFVSDVMT